MKFTIKTNGTFNAIKINKDKQGNTRSIEIDYTPTVLYSDMEFWLENEEKILDYAKMRLSKTKKMQFYKG